MNLSLYSQKPHKSFLHRRVIGVCKLRIFGKFYNIRLTSVGKICIVTKAHLPWVPKQHAIFAGYWYILHMLEIACNCLYNNPLWMYISMYFITIYVIHGWITDDKLSSSLTSSSRDCFPKNFETNYWHYIFFKHEPLFCIHRYRHELWII